MGFQLDLELIVFDGMVKFENRQGSPRAAISWLLARE